MDDLHAWVRQRLLARALATLDEANALQFDEHVRGCDPCRADLDQLMAESSADPAARGHLPPAMIARWPLASASLSGLERDAVRQHVERCDTCRDELRLLGHGTELTPAPWPSAGELVHRAASRARPWRAWWTGGAVGALATAVVLLLMLRPMQAPIGPTPPATRPPTQSTTRPSAPPPDAAPTLAALPWTAPAALRGAEVRLSVPAATREVALAIAIPPPHGADAAPRITVWGPDARLLATLLLAPDHVVAGTAFVVLGAPHPLLSGTYRVVIRAAADSTESFFELSVMP